jgi:hypothetical protein
MGRSETRMRQTSVVSSAVLEGPKIGEALKPPIWGPYTSPDTAFYQSTLNIALFGFEPGKIKRKEYWLGSFGAACQLLHLTAGSKSLIVRVLV